MNLALKKILVLPLLPLAFALFTGCGGQALSSKPGLSNPDPSPSPGASAPGVPENATTIPDIQKLGGWEDCTACTGSAFALYSMKEGIAAPSLSGASARFSMLPGTLPFGGALWFKFLTIDNSATHFVYDLYFYTDQPSAPQALEFNVSQSTGGNRYSFATQCDLSVHRAWMAWSPTENGWVSTGVPCIQAPPKTWNHLIWEFNRDTSGRAVFAAITLNGDRKEIGISMPPTPDKSNGIDVAFQLDANRTAAPYSVWLDKVNLSYW
jgi:hypothetical protein